MNVGDLVKFRYGRDLDRKIGIVTYMYMYNGHMWYKIKWNDGRLTDVAEVELVEIKTDKK